MELKYLYGWKCFVFICAVGPWYATRRPALALVSEPQPLGGRLLNNVHIHVFGTLVKLVAFV